MSLTQEQKNEIARIVGDYIEANIECNQPDSNYIISRNTFDEINDVVDAAMERCRRPSVAVEDAKEQDDYMRREFKKQIKEMNCDERP